MRIITSLKNNDLIKNTGIIAIGKLSTQVVSFFLLPVYTAYLTSEDYGVVDLLNTLIQLLLPIITLQIEQAVFRYLIEYRVDEKEKRRLISTTLIFIMLTGMLYTCFLIVANSFIHNTYKYFLLFNLLSSMFSYVFSQIARGLGYNGIYSIANFIMSVVNILLNIVFIVGGHMGATGMLLSGLISNIVCCIYIFIAAKLIKYIAIKDFSKVVCKKMILYSLPLIPNQISWWIFNASDRLIISAVLSIGINGIYAVASKFSTLFVTIFNYFCMSWTEQSAIHINDKNATNYFSETIEYSIRFFASLILGMIAVMPFAFKILINHQYNEAYVYIPVLLLGSYFNVIVGVISTIYVAKKETKSIAKTSIWAAIINLVVNLIFVKSIGLYAACISTVIAYAFLAIYRYIDIKKYMKLQINKISFVIFLIAYVLVYISYLIDNIFIDIIALIGSVIFFAIYNRKLLMKIIGIK